MFMLNPFAQNKTSPAASLCTKRVAPDHAQMESGAGNAPDMFHTLPIKWKGFGANP